MKLIHDCIRDVMLYIEENQELFGVMDSRSINLPNYSNEDITYTLIKLGEAGYLNIDSITLDENVIFKDITYAGHQFLDNIRDTKVWKETKSKLSKFETISIEFVSKVASQIILAMLQPINVN